MEEPIEIPTLRESICAKRIQLMEVSNKAMSINDKTYVIDCRRKLELGVLLPCLCYNSNGTRVATADRSGEASLSIKNG
jgi:hypothetical protein